MPISSGGITNHLSSAGSAEAITSPARQPVSRTKSDGAALLLASSESFSRSTQSTKSPPGTKGRVSSKSSKETAEEVVRKVVSLCPKLYVKFFCEYKKVAEIIHMVILYSQNALYIMIVPKNRVIFETVVAYIYYVVGVLQLLIVLVQLVCTIIRLMPSSLLVGW